MELRIGKNTSQTKNSRSRGARSKRWKQKCIQRIRANCRATRAISGNWKLTGGESVRVQRIYSVWRERKIGVSAYTRSSRQASCPARSKGPLAAHLERTKQPVETEFLQIGLSNLDKLRFDLDLLRNRKIQLLNDRIDKVQIVLRVTNDQPAALWKEGCACARRECHPLSFQELFCAFAIYELLTAGRFLGVLSCADGPDGSRCSRRCLVSSPAQQRAPAKCGADEIGWDPIFFCNQVVALFADRNDRYSVRFYLHLQPGLGRNVTQRFTERNLIER